MSGTNSSALHLSASCAILYNVNSLILTTSWLGEMNPPVWQTQSGFILTLLCWHQLLYLSFLLCRICASPADSSTRYQTTTSSHYITSHMQKEHIIKGIVSVSDCSLNLCSFSSSSLIKSTFWQSTPTCQIMEMSLENVSVLVSADGAAQPVWWTHHNLYFPELNYFCLWDNFIESACYFRGYNIIRWIIQSPWRTAFKGFQVSEWNLN